MVRSVSQHDIRSPQVEMKDRLKQLESLVSQMLSNSRDAPSTKAFSFKSQPKRE